MLLIDLQSCVLPIWLCSKEIVMLALLFASSWQSGRCTFALCTSVQYFLRSLWNKVLFNILIVMMMERPGFRIFWTSSNGIEGRGGTKTWNSGNLKLWKAGRVITVTVFSVFQIPCFPLCDPACRFAADLTPSSPYSTRMTPSRGYFPGIFSSADERCIPGYHHRYRALFCCSSRDQR